MYIDLSVSRFRNNNIFNDTAKYFQDLITADAERPRAECRADRSPQGAHCFVVVVRDDMSLFLSPEGTPICGGKKRRLYSSVNTALFKYSTGFKRTHSRIR